MSLRTEVLLWAQRVLAQKNGPPHLLLDVKEGCTPDEAQAAFHAIARTTHPDLHRKALGADELEMVTAAYAAVAGAYMTLRSQTMVTQRMRPLKPEDLAVGNAQPGDGKPVPRPGEAVRTPPAGAPAVKPAAAPAPAPAARMDLESLSSATAAQQMSPKALGYFRKAELALKRGDFKGAVLQLKLAIAADSTSMFLRNALAEVDAELRRTT